MFYQYNHFGTTEYFCREYGKDLNFPMHQGVLKNLQAFPSMLMLISTE